MIRKDLFLLLREDICCFYKRVVPVRHLSKMSMNPSLTTSLRTIKTGTSTDWDLVAMIFMISLLVGLYSWKKLGGPGQRKYAFWTFLALSIAFSVVMNTGNRPGGIYIVA